MKLFLVVMLVLVILILTWYLISFKAITNQKAAIIEDYSKMKIGTKVVIANGIYGEIVNLGKTTADVVIDKSKSAVIKVNIASIYSISS